MDQGQSSAFTMNYQNTYFYNDTISLHNTNLIYQSDPNVIFYEVNWFAYS